MGFIDQVNRAESVIRAAGRVSIKALGRELGISGDELDDLLTELIEVRQVAQRDGAVLIANASTVEATPTASDPERPGPQPRSYTPKHLVEQILASRSALAGERKQVTVMFADIRGSMDLAEQMGAETWHTILDRFFTLLAEGVHRFEGTVNQYTGDGIMALFGAPIAHEDHAERACYAALYLRDTLREFARTLRRERGLDLQTRIGLNSGEVVVGVIGDDLRMDYTAQGHTVGLAQRMEALAEVGSIYVAPATAALVSGFFDLEDLGEFVLKGVREPVRVAALQGPGRWQSRLDVSQARGFSRFIGRAGETAVLESALDAAKTEQGRVVGVVGEPGTGKSRLCFEFVQRCRARGHVVHVARCLSHGRNLGLHPILELARSLFEIGAQDAPQTVRNKIAGAAVLADRTLEAALPALFELFGVVEAGAGPRQDPEERVRRLLAALRALLAARSGRGEPTVLLIEDLHWIDDASQAFLRSFVQAAAHSHVQLLLNFRPEYHAAWMAHSWYQQLPLRAFDDATALEMLQDLLGHHESLTPLARQIIARTGGNPFFMEECVLILRDQGVLAGDRGACRLTVELPAITLPPRVEAIIAARIDRLRERERNVLRTAAAIGLEFKAPLLLRVGEWPEHELRAALHALVGAELLRETALYPDAAYAFKHPLTQQVAYDTQLAAGRAGIHARIARAFAESADDRPQENAALIAHHFDVAGDVALAAHWHRHAARWAGPFEAELMARHWRRVRELAMALPVGTQRDSLLIDASFGLSESLRRAADVPAEVDAAYQAGLACARANDDLSAEAKITSAYVGYRLSTGRWDPALVRQIENIGDRVDQLEGDGLRAYVWYVLALVRGHVGAGDRESAAERSLELLAASPGCAGEEYGPLEIFAMMHLAYADIFAGRLAEAVVTHARLAALADRMQRPIAPNIALAVEAELALRTGDTAEALRLSESEGARVVTPSVALQVSMPRRVSVYRATGNVQAVAGVL